MAGATGAGGQLVLVAHKLKETLNNLNNFLRELKRSAARRSSLLMGLALSKNSNEAVGVTHRFLYISIISF